MIDENRYAAFFGQKDKTGRWPEDDRKMIKRLNW
jgi:hypothetical protein